VIRSAKSKDLISYRDEANKPTEIILDEFLYWLGREIRKSKHPAYTNPSFVSPIMMSLFEISPLELRRYNDLEMSLVVGTRLVLLFELYRREEHKTGLNLQRTYKTLHRHQKIKEHYLSARPAYRNKTETIKRISEEARAENEKGWGERTLIKVLRDFD
jgi:hypothetical protein